MDMWMLWLIVAVLLIVAEIFTLTAALGLLGAAALIASLSAAVGLPPAVQLLVFAVASTAGLLLVRPIARRHMLRPQIDRFGVDALVGRSARVVQEVTGQAGRIRIDGEEWTARAFDESLVIPTGAMVDVMEIRGAIAVVYPKE